MQYLPQLLSAFAAGCIVGWLFLGRTERTIRLCVWAFHVKFRLPRQHVPFVPAPERTRLRFAMLFEEAFEALDAAYDVRPPGTDGVANEEVIALMSARSVIFNYINTGPVKVNLPDLADAFTDIDYIVEGSRIEFGIRGWPVLKEVQRANMAKVGGPVRHDGKILKPPGWQAPQIDLVLYAQGWDGVDDYRTKQDLPQRSEAAPPSAA